MAQEKTSKSMSIRGKAAVLAIGTAVPPNYIYQSDYPDYYRRVTKTTEHHSDELMDKFKRICTGTMIQKRYFHLTEEMIEAHPNIADHKEPSLDARNAILAAAVPELAKQAAEKALQEWGQPRSKITHLIFHTSSGCVELPSPHCKLTNLLGLSPTVNRFMLFYNGCHTGAIVLHLANDVAESNPGARVLAVCSEITASIFRGPETSSTDNLVAQALFGDGAAAVIVGSDPYDLSAERPLFEIVVAKEALVPDTHDAIHGCVTEAGLMVSLSRQVAMHITNNIGSATSRALAPLGITDLNSLFWIVHPGGPKILDGIEQVLKLQKEKLAVTRHVLAEYGNVASGGAIFIMDEMRRRSEKEGKAMTGEGHRFGVFIGFGPGLTVETLVLAALPVDSA